MSVVDIYDRGVAVATSGSRWPGRQTVRSSPCPWSLEMKSRQEARLELDDRQADGHARIMRPEGRLDMASAPALRHQMRQLMDSGVAKLVLDMTEVSFVDSSGLGAIISGLKLARQAGGDLRIACPNQQVLVVL